MASIAASNVSTSAFGCKLPTIGYEHCENPAHAHALIREAREQGPIAMGPHGPEVLTYDLVRTVLRDNRFAMPQLSLIHISEPTRLIIRSRMPSSA